MPGIKAAGGFLGSGGKTSETTTTTTTTAATGYGRDIGGSNYAGFTATSGGSITVQDQGALAAALAIADKAFQSMDRAGQGAQAAYQAAIGQVSAAYTQASGAVGTQELTKYGVVAIALVAVVWAMTRNKVTK